MSYVHKIYMLSKRGDAFGNHYLLFSWEPNQRSSEEDKASCSAGLKSAVALLPPAQKVALMEVEKVSVKFNKFAPANTLRGLPISILAAQAFLQVIVDCTLLNRRNLIWRRIDSGRLQPFAIKLARRG